MTLPASNIEDSTDNGYSPGETESSTTITAVRSPPTPEEEMLYTISIAQTVVDVMLIHGAAGLFVVENITKLPRAFVTWIVLLPTFSGLGVVAAHSIHPVGTPEGKSCKKTLVPLIL